MKYIWNSSISCFNCLGWDDALMDPLLNYISDGPGVGMSFNLKCEGEDRLTSILVAIAAEIV